MRTTSDTPVGLDVIVGIDDGRNPLVKGLRVKGRVIATDPPSTPLADRFAVIEPDKVSPPAIVGNMVHASIRYRNENWGDLRSGKMVMVNIILVNSEKKELARAVGSLRPQKAS